MSSHLTPLNLTLREELEEETAGDRRGPLSNEGSPSSQKCIRVRICAYAFVILLFMHLC